MARRQTEKLSRIGKQPVELPDGVTASLDGNTVTIKGPKGELTRTLSDRVEVVLNDDGDVEIHITGASNEDRSTHGLSRALVANMVVGVSKGFERKLEVIGIGYRADLRKNHILFQLGYSHPILYEIPPVIDVEIGKDNSITLRSIDKEALGHAAAKIRGFRPPEPYKGKGIKYADETIIRKAGKAAAR